MKKLVVAAVVALATACAPSINPQMKSATDEMIAAVRGGHDVAAPTAWEPMPWAEGQWVLMRVVDGKGQPTLVKMSVVREEDGGFWIETETRDYYRHSVAQVLYTRVPRTPEEAADSMQRIVTWAHDEERQEFDFTSNDPAMRFARTMMKSVAQTTFVPAIESTTQEDATVPAGTFRGCAKMQVKATVGTLVSDSTSWFHPAVPINGTVKAVSADGKWTSELLDFGLTGAASAL